MISNRSSPSPAFPSPSHSARWALTALLLAGAGGCATTSKGTTRDVAGWREVKSEHFAVRTNLSPEDARDADRYLESSRAALLALFGPRADRPLPAPTAVTVFATEAEFHRYFPRQLGGLYFRSGYPDQIFLFGTPADWDERRTITTEGHGSVVKHEMTHALAAGVFLRQPRWFNEGLAQYLETFEVAPDGQSVTYGAAMLGALHGYHRFGSAGTADLFEWGRRKLDDQTASQLMRDYALAWALVHYLINTHLKDVAKLEDAFAAGVPPGEAWKRVFPGLTPADLDVALNQYIQHGDYQLFSLPLHAKPGVVTVRALPATEAELAHAEAAFRGASLTADGRDAKLAEGRADVREVLEADPDNVKALQLQPYAKREERLAAGRRAVQRHPEDAEAWLLLSSGLSEHAERVDALEHALRLDPSSPVPLNNLAWDEISHGRADEGLAKAERAVALVPWDSAFVDTLAHGYAAVGRCDEALRTESRALDLFPEGASQAARQRTDASAEKLRAGCEGGQKTP